MSTFYEEVYKEVYNTDTSKKLPGPTSQSPLPNCTKVLSFSKLLLNNDENSVLKLGLSFTPTPPQNIPDLEYNLYQFLRKRRLTYHFRNSNFQDVFLVKMPSFTHPPKKHQEQENICKQMEHTPNNYVI